MSVKQVIIIRTKYVNSKGEKVGIRRGKEISQSAHASMAFMSHILQESIRDKSPPKLTKPVEEWIKGLFTKIVLQVDNEETLLEIDKLAKEAGLLSNLITDAGMTEFNGVPTITTAPTNKTVCSGNSTGFTVTATGTGLTYQWRKGNTNLTNTGNISGATSSSLTINPATSADAAND